jgi:ABC-type antimicrobial peptide transport system permease subunit
MRIKQLTKLSTRMFKARASRTLLTIVGMGVGIGAVLFLVAMGYGIQRTLMETIATSDSLLSLDVYPSKDKNNISLEEIKKIENMEGVAEISPVFETVAQVKLNNLVSNSKALIITPPFLNLNGTEIASGQKLDEANPNGLIISSTFAKMFNEEPDKMLGRSIKISLAVPKDWSGEVKNYNYIELAETFKIIGVVESKENLIYLNLKSLSGTDVIPSFSRLKVRCQDSNAVSKIRENISAADFSVSALTDVVSQADRVFKIVRIVLGFFGLIALLVSAIGMFNTMTVTLLERTEEIGIMKSIGASDGNILTMFVFESTLMGFLGGICGIILGIAGGEIFNLVVNFIAVRLGGASVSLFYFPLWFLGVILFSGAVVGFFTGLIPAKKASATDPLDALRYK